MSVKPFSTFLLEDVRKDITFTFGRFNPPTIGHEKLLQAVKDTAKNGPFRIYVSPSHDSKKNPLNPKQKIAAMRELFPKFARNIMGDYDAANVLQVCTKLYDQGYTSVTLVVGSDRVDEFNALLKKYNGQNLSANGFYNFKSIRVVSAGERDPDSDSVAGVSASKMRAAAEANDFAAFSSGLPKDLPTRTAKGFSEALFNAVRRGMGLAESTFQTPHVQLEPVSEVREAYVSGNLYQIDERVVHKSGEECTIRLLGSNYLIVEMAGSGVRKRVWLSDVNKLMNEGKDYDVTVHHVHHDGRREEHVYHVKNAVDHNHAGYIALQKHRAKGIPSKLIHTSANDAKEVASPPTTGKPLSSFRS